MSVLVPTGLTTTELTDDELDSRLRAAGVFDDHEVIVAVLEPTGELSVRRRPRPH